jgi:hypothetical protein
MAGHEHWRQRPAEVARQAVNRESVAESRRRDVAVQNGEIGGVEDAVAESGQGSNDGQPEVAIDSREQQRRQQKAADSRAQNAGGAVAIDEKSGQRLADRRDDEEDRHGCSDAGKA